MAKEDELLLKEYVTLSPDIENRKKERK